LDKDKAAKFTSAGDKAKEEEDDEYYYDEDFE